MISDLRVMRSVWIKADHCKIITDKSLTKVTHI